MVEFRTEYYTPMDRGYHERAEMAPIRSDANIEQPITVGDIGQTVPEHDPSGRFKNILQNVQAAIRGGTGNLQLVFQTPIESAIGGRPKSYGEEVRTAIREVAMAGEVQITGMEMPTSLTNLSGWDQQRNVVDEEKRQRDLDEVKEMVRFAAEVGQGGGVDIVSWEYDRPVHRASWWKEGSADAKSFERLAKEEKRKEEIRFVDERSGQVVPIGIREGIFVFKDKDKNFQTISETQEPQKWGYEDFEKYAQFLRKQPGKQEYTVYDAIKEHFLESQMNVAAAEASIYRQRLEGAQQMLAEAERRNDPRLKAAAEQDITGAKAGIMAQKRTIQEFKERIENWTPMDEYVLKKSQDSFAEAGITAMQMQDKSKIPIKQDLYVGPEIGWPNYYGSHPKEFAEMILESRKAMQEKLVKQGFSPSRAASEARRHIKGTFDTSHVGMWLQNFQPDKPWDVRIKNFNKWYKDQVEWLGQVNEKEDIIGGIQAVDSAGAGHGHLPPGQGILPVKEAVEILRKHGYGGHITSEGHEEEKFGEGRILLKSWQKFNAPISGNYLGGAAPQRWGNIQQGYFGRTYSPNFMFGAYAPSNEFKLWSDVPLE